MSPTRADRLALLVISILSFVVPWASRAVLAECPVVGYRKVEKGIGIENGNTSQASFHGKAVAQVFTAEDTLVSAVTVWRIGGSAPNRTPMHLFLTEADSTGRPLPLQVVYDGPVLGCICDSTEDVPVRFDLEPPAELPRTGKFCLVIKEDSESCASGFSLRADSTDSYPDGGAWQIGAATFCVGLGGNVFPLIGNDLIFEVEFCRPEAVPAGEESWGSVKARYR